MTNHGGSVTLPVFRSAIAFLLMSTAGVRPRHPSRKHREKGAAVQTGIEILPDEQETGAAAAKSEEVTPRGYE